MQIENETDLTQDIIDEIEESESVTQLGTLKTQRPVTQIISLDDSKEATEWLSNKRVPDILPKGSYQKLPPMFEWIIKKLDDNPALVNKIKNLLKEVIMKLGKESGTYEEIFTNTVPIPKNLDTELMKLLGITSVQHLLHEADLLGFNIQNRMMSKPYYIILSILFYYGCKPTKNGNKDGDQFLRQACVVLIVVMVYKGRISKFWKAGFDQVTVKYVMENKLKKSNIAYLYPNTFNANLYIWTPRLDTKYWETVREHPAHPRRGIVSILIASRNRLHQAYVGLANHYYDAFAAGYKTGSYQNDEIEEKQKLSRIGQVVDKIYTSITYFNNPVPDADREYIREKLKISHLTVSKFEEFIKNDKNKNETERIIELIVSTQNLVDPNDIANMKVVDTAEKITAARAKDVMGELKNNIDNVIRLIFDKQILNASPAQQLKIRKAFVLLFVLKIKQIYKKQSSYFEKKIF